MPRPRRRRRVHFLPGVSHFLPEEVFPRHLEEVAIHLEELEALRLHDLMGLEQEDCAARMEISRPTFHRVLAEARRKVAEALVEGKAIRLRGGDYRVATSEFRCLDCDNEWEMPLGTGEDSTSVTCTSCQSGNVLRTDAAEFGLVRRGWGRRGRRGGGARWGRGDPDWQSDVPGAVMNHREMDDWGDAVGQPRRRLSLGDLIANHTLDSRLAAYLWTVMDGAPSLLVLSGPRQAGKTTTVNALLDLAPEESRFIPIRGNRGAFDFPDRPAHVPTYLVASEISPGPGYVWGEGARHLFAGVQQGYRLSATMHADSIEEALEQLQANPNGVLLEQVAALGLVVVIAVGREAGGVRRRVAQVYRIRGLEDGGEGLKTELACTWFRAEDAFHLSDRLEVTPEEVAARAAFLDDLVTRGVRAPEEVRDAVRSYRSRAGGSV